MPQPFLRAPEEMDQLVQRLGHEGYDLSRIRTIGQRVNEEQRLLDTIKRLDPKIDGNAHELVKQLAVYKQEVDRKERWYEKILKAPGRLLKKGWETVKRHPFLTALAVLAISGAVAFYVNPALFASLKAWIASKLGALGIGNAAEAAKQTVEKAAEAAKEAAGKAMEKVPVPPPIPDTLPPLPTDIPSLEEAEKILKGLEKMP